ncbi:MAG: tetratricopeptide repeat protein [Acidobacteria bacterium]|nr:tetratricopeptide repeat protein [Acidobacteriota bacterium]
MKKLLCLLGVGVLLASLTACGKVEARIAIRQANEHYQAEQYAKALEYYEDARELDPSFPDLNRMVGYCNIGLFEPGNDKPENNKFADTAIEELQKYLKQRPKDETAREALINLFLNAERTSQAIDYFKEYLKENPADLNAVRSVATLYAKSGDFNESLNWYKKITLLDSKNPEAFYTYGVVCYEKVAKNPPEDLAERLAIIEMGRAALLDATKLREKYFEALVYINLLYREQAKLETDPEKQASLMAEAETYRNQAVEISRARKAAEKAASEAQAK